MRKRVAIIVGPPTCDFPTPCSFDWLSSNNNDGLLTVSIKEIIVQTALFLVLLNVFGCKPCSQDPIVEDRKAELRRIVNVALTSHSVKSRIQEVSRAVQEYRLNENFTSIYRESGEYERGVYDTVWALGAASKPYAVLEYNRKGLVGLFHFIAIWPFEPHDSIPSRQCIYVLISREGVSTSGPKSTVWSNIDSTTCNKMFPGLVIDTMQVSEKNLTVSYELLQSRPIDFFLNVEIDGVPLRMLSPDRGVVY